MALRFEALCGGQLVDGPGDLALEIGAGRDVGHPAGVYSAGCYAISRARVGLGRRRDARLQPARSAAEQKGIAGAST